MRILDLFAGKGGEERRKKVEALGHSYITLDNDESFNCDIACDILEYNPIEKFDMIWASPPCEAFSVASIGHHWGGGDKAYIPKTNWAKKSIKILGKTIELIKTIDPKWWYIENPVGMMRAVGNLGEYVRATVTYCQYGEKYMKPTDIWTNDIDWATWKAKRCKNGDSCHEPAPRGSKTGTQGIKGSDNRAIVPWGLWESILEGK